MCKALGIQQNLSTAFHPCTDGQMERMNAFFFFFELEVYTPLLTQQELARLLRQNLCVISEGLQQLLLDRQSVILLNPHSVPKAR